MAGGCNDKIAMTRTIRTYNNPRKRVFWVVLGRYRYTEMDFETGARKEHVPDKEDYDRLKHAVLCMGNCSYCKDKRKNQLKRTYKRREFHFVRMESGY